MTQTEESSEAHGLRIQRSLEESLDRHAGQSEEARAEALARTLETELSRLDASQAEEVLGLLADQYASVSRPVDSLGDQSARIRELEAELAALRANPPAPVVEPSAFVNSVAELLLGGRGDVDALLADRRQAEERLLGLIRALLQFSTLVSQAFLGVEAEPDATMSGRVRSEMADELSGRMPSGTFEAMLGQVQHQISNQILAFREACEVGAQNLLKQVSPHAIASEVAGGSMSVLGIRPLREQWERFEERYEELRRADNLFEDFFDGAFRKAVFRLTRDDQDISSG